MERSQREAGEARGYEARAAWPRGGVLEQYGEQASKRNEVDTALSRLAADLCDKGRLDCVEAGEAGTGAWESANLPRPAG